MKIIDKFSKGQHDASLGSLRRAYHMICTRERAATQLYVGAAGGPDAKTALNSQRKAFKKNAIDPTTAYVLAQPASREDALELCKGLIRHISKEDVVRLSNDERRHGRDLEKWLDVGTVPHVFLAVESSD